MPSVFVSHSTVAKETVQNQIFSRLDVENIDIHYAEDNPGKNREDEKEFRDVLNNFDWFLVVLSETTIKSERVQAQVDLAFKYFPVEKILPVLIEECDPSICHQKLAHFDCFDFYDNTEVGVSQLTNQLGIHVATVDFSHMVMEIFEEIYELDPVEIERVLDEKAGDDLVLRQEVKKMLNGKAGADSLKFLDQPITDLGGRETLIGKSVGAFKVVRKIAEGGMGVVYEARHTHLDRTVALKIPILTHQNLNVLAMRLKREGKALAKLRHPNVVEVYDAGITDDGIPFVAMGYVNGKSLYEIVKAELGTPAQIKKWIIQVAEALHYLHMEKIVHRDVKSSNIMIDQHDNAILMDFGIAHIGDLTRVTVHNPGTPAYMCPEQRKGKPSDGRCDIYSLGLVLYELLTREIPVDPDLKNLPKTNRELRLMAGVIAKCIKRDPKDRYQTGKEMVAALSPVRELPRRSFILGAAGLLLVSLLAVVLIKNIKLPERATATPPAISEVVRPQIIEDLINQSGSVSVLMPQLVSLRNQGALSFGNETDFLNPDGCYIFVYENEHEPARAVLAPGSSERTELLQGNQMSNISDYLQGKAAIWVSVTD
ncbi:MAG: protein kinase [Rhodothermales bacterium]